MNEVPVVFILDTERARRKLRLQVEAECALCLRMAVEYFDQNVFSGLFLKYACVLPESQQMQPRRENQLVADKAAVRPKPPCGMHITVVRQISLVGLLNPERDRLGNERFQFKRIAQ
jgi:hypothetical protein